VVERVSRPVFSQAEADQQAECILNERAEELIRGTAETIGIPELLAGKNVELAGLGKKFSKTYYIVSTRHTVDSSGYRTSFDVRESTIPENGKLK
ncbi:MAG: hypothetical protein WAN36_00920, partial [Calditrichia bacterium]